MSLVLSDYPEKQVPLDTIFLSDLLSPGGLLFVLGLLAITTRALMGTVMAVLRGWHASCMKKGV